MAGCLLAAVLVQRLADLLALQRAVRVVVLGVPEARHDLGGPGLRWAEVREGCFSTVLARSGRRAGEPSEWYMSGVVPTPSKFQRPRKVSEHNPEAGFPRCWRCGLQQPPLILAAANRTRVLRYYDLAPVEPNVEVCGAAPAAWTTKKSGVTYACRVLGFERDRPGCVDRLLARMRATAPGDRHTPGCGLFKRGARGRPPP